MIRVLILSIFLVGCANLPASKHTLHWKLKDGEKIVYRTVQTEIASDQGLNFHAHEVLQNASLREKVKRDLSSLTHPFWMQTHMTKNNHNPSIQVKIVSIKPTFNTPPKDEVEAYKRENIESQAGNVQLIAEIENNGDLQSFYLTQKQRNITRLLFDLPNDPISVGDYWQLPINILEIGLGFYPNTSSRINNVSLESVSRTKEGELTAGILFIIGENLNGEFRYTHSDKTVPIAINSSYIGYGEFSIDKGHWNTLTIQSYSSGQGFPPDGRTILYQLKLME